MTSLYLYGFVGAGMRFDAPPPAVAAPETAVAVLACGPVAMLASPLAADDVAPARRNLLAHTRVLEAAMAHGPVLPMRFGTVAPDADAVRRAAEAEAGALLDTLDRLAGHTAVGLRAAFTGDALFRRIAALDPGLAAAAARLRAADPRAAHERKLDLGRRVEALMGEVRAAEAAVLDAVARPFAADVRTLPASGETAYANLSLLVPAARETELFQALSAYEAARAGEVALRYVAPLPAYDFVDLRLVLDAPRAEAA